MPPKPCSTTFTLTLAAKVDCDLILQTLNDPDTDSIHAGNTSLRLAGSTSYEVTVYFEYYIGTEATGSPQFNLGP